MVIKTSWLNLTLPPTGLRILEKSLIIKANKDDIGESKEQDELANYNLN